MLNQNDFSDKIAIAFSVMESVFHTSLSWNMFISPTVSTIDYKYVVYTNCYKFLRYIFVPNRPVVLMSGTEIPLYTCIYDFMLQCILITCYYFIYVGIEFHAECNILLLYYKHITSQTYFFRCLKKKMLKVYSYTWNCSFFVTYCLELHGKSFSYPRKQNVMIFVVVTLLLH